LSFIVITDINYISSLLLSQTTKAQLSLWKSAAAIRISCSFVPINRLGLLGFSFTFGLQFATTVTRGNDNGKIVY